MENLIEKSGRPIFLIDVEDNGNKDICFDFSVYEVVQWDMQKTPLKINLYIKGTIKWDGCSHFYFGEEDGYLHLCGRGCFNDLREVIDRVWYMAEERIDRFNKDVAY